MNDSKAVITGRLSNVLRLRVNVVLAIGTIYLLFAFNSLAQSPVTTRNIPVPTQEQFALADGLITLNTVAGKTVYLDTIRLYNKDGSIWYEFSLDRNHPLYYKRHQEPGFKPFAPLDSFQIALRLKSASQNWYEVIIDDTTQETKYFWAGEFLLRRDTFERYILLSSFITFDQQDNPLRKAPSGNLSTLQLDGKESFSPNNFDGEWLRVEINRKPYVAVREFGWVRWRRGREILIGFMLNCKECL